MLRKLMATSPVWMTVPVRLGLGVILAAHGAQKVLGSFNGPGLSKWISFPAPFPFMRPAWLWMGAAAFAELIGGILVLLGLLTRLGAFLLFCTMLTAIAGVHWKGGLFLPEGFEYPLALLAMSLALIISGGGIVSLDLALSSGRRR
jgi:putative oxidoreductase